MTTEYLYRQELDRVLAALMPQNQLIVKVMLHTGMRLSDVLELRTEGLSTSGWYTEGKTGKKRRYGLPKPLLEAIQEQAGPVWAFPGRKMGTHKTRQAVWKERHSVGPGAKASGPLAVSFIMESGAVSRRVGSRGSPRRWAASLLAEPWRGGPDRSDGQSECRKLGGRGLARGRAWRTVSGPPWVVLLATSFWMPGPLAQAGKPQAPGRKKLIWQFRDCSLSREIAGQ